MVSERVDSLGVVEDLQHAEEARDAKTRQQTSANPTFVNYALALPKLRNSDACPKDETIEGIGLVADDCLPQSHLRHVPDVAHEVEDHVPDACRNEGSKR